MTNIYNKTYLNNTICKILNHNSTNRLNDVKKLLNSKIKNMKLFLQNSNNNFILIGLIYRKKIKYSFNIFFYLHPSLSTVTFIATYSAL